jgi:hypothetical protein
MKLLIPKFWPDCSAFSNLPFFFIAGPVIGGGDWQIRMCWAINGLMNRGEFVAAIPCRWKPNHTLSPYFMRGDMFDGRQTIWERILIQRAIKEALHGCALIYFAKQVELRPAEFGAYARDSFGEVAELRGRMMHDPTLRVVVGADPEFDPNAISVMKCNFEDALGYDFPIYTSIADTAKAAVATATAA